MEERALLENFVVGNRDLERLERLLNEFSIFEALGAVRQELRHSDFLAFLLNPYQNHGLGDAFLKRFLKQVLFGASSQEVTPVEVDVADLSSAFVRREWRNVDIFIQDARTHLLCVIENKLTSGEHSGQLRRYRETVTQQFPGYRRIFVFLTPEGDIPSDEAYVPFSYGEIAELVDEIREAHASTLGAGVRTLMTHYTTMLRRHIVSDSEIAELCRKLYREHQQALDLIYEHRPDLQYDLSEMLKELIVETAPTAGLVLDHSTKTYIRFAVEDWDQFPVQLSGHGWVPSDRILVFEFDNATDRLSLKLIIGPGPQPVRRGIHQALQDRRKLFSLAGGSTNKKYKTVYKKIFLTSRDYEEGDWDGLVEKVERRWQQFLDRDLPRIRQAVQEIPWDELDTA
jgi:hypothetical protein